MERWEIAERSSALGLIGFIDSPALIKSHLLLSGSRLSFTIGENVPGHGLGLNLARELVRLHGGDLWLVESNGDWTEFAVRFRSARVRAGHETRQT